MKDKRSVLSQQVTTKHNQTDAWSSHVISVSARSFNSSVSLSCSSRFTDASSCFNDACFSNLSLLKLQTFKLISLHFSSSRLSIRSSLSKNAFSMFSTNSRSSDPFKPMRSPAPIHLSRSVMLKTMSSSCIKLPKHYPGRAPKLSGRWSGLATTLSLEPNGDA